MPLTEEIPYLNQIIDILVVQKQLNIGIRVGA
jgi:hypothetical protein